MEQLIIYIRACDFKNVVYSNPFDCPLARAVKRTIKDIVDVGVDYTRVNIQYKNVVRIDYECKYNIEMFNEDLPKATQFKFSGTIVRRVLLTKK